jgi:hypothetical protein
MAAALQTFDNPTKPVSIPNNSPQSDLIKQLTQKAIAKQKQKQMDTPAPSPKFAPKTDSTSAIASEPLPVPKPQPPKEEKS